MRLGPRSPGTTGVAGQRDFQQQALETVARETWTPVTRNHGGCRTKRFPTTGLRNSGPWDLDPGHQESRGRRTKRFPTTGLRNSGPWDLDPGHQESRGRRTKRFPTTGLRNSGPWDLDPGHQESRGRRTKRFPTTGLRNSGPWDLQSALPPARSPGTTMMMGKEIPSNRPSEQWPARPGPPPPSPPSHTHNSPSQVARNHGVEGQRFLTTALRNSGPWDLDRTPPQQPGHQVLLDKDSRLQHLETVARKTWRPSLSDHQEHYGVLQGREVCVQKQPLETQDSSPYSLKVLHCFPARSSGTP